MVKQDLKSMGFGDAAIMTVEGMECFVARCGYTGEDGFEIFVPGENAVKLWQTLCAQPEVRYASGSTLNTRIQISLKTPGFGI